MSSADFQPKIEPEPESFGMTAAAQVSTPAPKDLAPKKTAVAAAPGGGMFGSQSAETTELGGGKSQGGG
jgi:hypothetical protein